MVPPLRRGTGGALCPCGLTGTYAGLLLRESSPSPRGSGDDACLDCGFRRNDEVGTGDAPRMRSPR